MEAYIRGIGNISPQPTFDNDTFLEDIREYSHPRLQSVLPDFKNFIQPVQLRRMSRLLRMGVTAAGISLRDAGIEKPDAIITGTGLGMMEETEKFLNGLLDNQERLLNPTAFIQSTHNTVGASIAVMLGCNNYNLTYVHGPVSFEHALLDSLMWMEEKPTDNVLLGGVEEITEDHYRITESMGFWKSGEINSLKILGDKKPGTLAGEGASFFVMSKEADPHNYALLRGLALRFNPGKQDILSEFINAYLQSYRLTVSDMDLVITGLNGDPSSDIVYSEAKDAFGSVPVAYYKHLCGEHYLASSFSLWLAAKILRSQTVPEVVLTDPARKPGKVHNILIHNHYKNLHHSLMLLSSC
jgi:3-oxoacyl-[acyl-carrier-protein] synthase II